MKNDCYYFLLFQELEASLKLLKDEKIISNKLSLDMKDKQSQLENDLIQALTKVDSITVSHKQSEDKLLAMRKLTIQTVKDLCVSKLNEGAQQPLEFVPKLSSQIEVLLNKLGTSAHMPIDDCVAKIHDILHLGYYFIELYEQCDIIYTTTTDIEKGEGEIQIPFQIHILF